jgi:hypothetical protein
MYRFCRKINANGAMNTEFFTEDNEGGVPPVLITQQGHKGHKDRILVPALIRFFRRFPWSAAFPRLRDKADAVGTLEPAESSSSKQKTHREIFYSRQRR